MFSPIDSTAPSANQSVIEIEDLTIDRNRVLKLLKEIKMNKASGPDGISAPVLKEIADVVAGPLCNIFNQSLKFGTVPDNWRHANITPIYKKGDRSKPENYRPISLTCIASKVMEHIVTSHIMKFVEGNNLLYPKQHGFRAKLSCETQLVELVTDIFKEHDNGKEVDECLLDFSKAFDNVSHAKLLAKMTSMEICDEQIASWTAAFCRDRTQVVTLQRALFKPLSSYIWCPTGVCG